MGKEKICAGFVLYNPELSLFKKNFNRLYGQVDKIFIFDNGSSNHCQVEKIFGKNDRVVYHYESNNLGIAYALNFLLKMSRNANYEWCLTMDQDSICSSNLIHEYSKYISDKTVALICPFILNNNKFTLDQYRKMNIPNVVEVKDPVSCITSGCLTNVEIFSRIGGVNEKLFIDFVDTELSCKVMENGYKILRVNSTYLIQQQGIAHRIPCFTWLYKKTNNNIFRRLMVATVYTDHRLYLSSRNSRYLRNKYRNHGLRTSFIFMFLFYCYFTIFYPPQRSRKKMWKNIMEGFHDYKYIK